MPLTDPGRAPAPAGTCGAPARRLAGALLCAAALGAAALEAAGPPSPPRPYRVLHQRLHDPRFLALSADGRWLASFGTDRGLAPGAGDPVLLWDVKRGKRVGRFPLPGLENALLEFLPDGKGLVAGARWDLPGEDPYVRVRVLEVPSGKVRRAFKLPRLRGWWGVPTPDGKALVVSGVYESAAVHDLATGKELAVLKGPERLPKPSDPKPKPGAPDAAARKRFEDVTCALALSADGKRVAVGTYGGWVSVWDLPRRKRLWRQGAADEAVTALGFSPDGKSLACTCRSWHRVSLWDAARGVELARVQRPTSNDRLHYMPDGHGVLFGDFTRSGATGLVRWEPEGNRWRRRAEPPRFPNIGGAALAMSADGHYAAYVTDIGTGPRPDRRIVVWDLRKLFPAK
jgi:WD40 repeat protein